MKKRKHKRDHRGGERMTKAFSACKFTLSMIMLTPAAAWAALPLISDDAGTMGRGNFQLEINAQYDHDKAQGVTTKGGEVDPIFSYGVTDTIDIVVITPYLWVKEKSDDALINSSENGFSDSTLDVKIRFFEKTGLSFAIKPGLDIPTGDEDKGLGTGKLGYHLYLLGTKETGPWTFIANLGYMRNETDSASEEKNLWQASIASIYVIDNHWKVAADLIAEKNTDKVADNDPVSALGGIIYTLTKDIDLDLGAKAGLTSSATDWSLLAGATIRF